MDTPSPTFNVNDRVKHWEHGFGTVVGVTGKKADVQFDDGTLLTQRAEFHAHARG
jgi:hypothetical protein